MANKLHRHLGFWDVFCFSTGAMISSGIFILPGLAYRQSGPLVFVSYLLAGLLACLGTLSIIELATAMPKAGGDYYYITRSLGPLAGTISSIMSWMALCLKSAFAIFGIAEILFLAFGFPLMVSSLITCVFFVLLNIYGIKESAKFELALVAGLLGILLFLIVGGITKISFDNFRPLLPNGINPILATSGFVFISFGGLINIASIAEEIKNPSKNIPKGMLSSVCVVSVLYTLILIVTVGILPGDALSNSLTPIADVGRSVFGDFGFYSLSIAALLAFITTANAGILSASRYPLALSHDRLFPTFIGKLTKKGKTPFVSITLTGLIIYLSLWLDLETLVKLGSIVILTLYILSNVAVILLHEGKVQNYKPTFKIPLYPWLNILSILLFVILLFDLGLVAVEISLGLIVVAVSIYIFYGRKRHKIEYALIHVVERIINKRLTSHGLENELKNVLLQRDEVKIDRIHTLFEDATILDLNGPITADTLFEILSETIADDVHLSQKEIIKLLSDREKEGSTAITHFVAIPHIIIPGSNRFKLLVVRCLKGVKFTENNESVKAIFVLFGTQDERSFHLKVLAAIAQIVQNQFEKPWLAAKTKENLRDYLLLSERRRH
jgi:APA family basic amino acid/polyamine antiporter